MADISCQVCTKYPKVTSRARLGDADCLGLSCGCRPRSVRTPVLSQDAIYLPSTGIVGVLYMPDRPCPPACSPGSPDIIFYDHDHAGRVTVSRLLKRW